ncbi:hypothetical protein Ddye_006639 [Dipteronia dyeriana]|uniref:BSD domain-containing protein n=1 Tax=Dipteronia dyeriana TaxID=168575 RepID=A0AAD9XID3_9ROSI|nr:hypothetical protein Ddye_006639 [Dipteronia dyeriana]
MSWLARSIANSLRIDEDGVEENDVVPNQTQPDLSPTAYHQISPKEEQLTQSELEEEDETQSRGVKEDLTELKQTLTRQFWGVASFLAPPADSNSNLDESGLSGQSDEEDPVNSGIGVSEMDTNNLQFRSDENEEGEELAAVGITDEVLAFATNIAHHPETWLDFPLDEEDDLDDFDMSDAQKKHAFAIQHFAPRLAALRIELCPCHMSEKYFWKVYFVLLHSRLNKPDAEILSTPQVVEARAVWMQELQKQTKPETDWLGRSASFMKDSTNVVQEDFDPTSSNFANYDLISHRTYTTEPSTSTMMTYYEEKHPIESTEVQFIDKSVIEENPVTEDKHLLVGPSSKIQIPDYEEEEDDDDWPEADSELGDNETPIYVGNEDDISFSDLEDDVLLPVKPKKIV